MKVLILTFGGDVHNFFTRCVSRDTWGDATFGFVSSKCSGVVLSCFTPSRSTIFTAVSESTLLHLIPEDSFSPLFKASLWSVSWVTNVGAGRGGIMGRIYYNETVFVLQTSRTPVPTPRTRVQTSRTRVQKLRTRVQR